MASSNRLRRHRHSHRELEGPVLQIPGFVFRASQIVGRLLQHGLPQFDAGPRRQVFVDVDHAVPKKSPHHRATVHDLAEASDRWLGFASRSSRDVHLFPDPIQGGDGIGRRIERFPTIEFVGRENL